MSTPRIDRWLQPCAEAKCSGVGRDVSLPPINADANVFVFAVVTTSYPAVGLDRSRLNGWTMVSSKETAHETMGQVRQECWYRLEREKLVDKSYSFRLEQSATYAVGVEAYMDEVLRACQENDIPYGLVLVNEDGW